MGEEELRTYNTSAIPTSRLSDRRLAHVRPAHGTRMINEFVSVNVYVCMTVAVQIDTPKFEKAGRRSVQLYRAGNVETFLSK